MTCHFVIPRSEFPNTLQLAPPWRDARGGSRFGLYPGGVIPLLMTLCLARPITAQPSPPDAPAVPTVERSETPKAQPSERQAKHETAFVEMLSGATLEGSFTSTGRDRDPTKLSREKYTIGEVKKLAPNVWLIPARIQYGEHDVTLPVTVPIHWAGDTPVIVIDNQSLPGFGTVSARVMFFADHYAGYWKHGVYGGHLFGTISRDKEAQAEQIAPTDERPRPGDNSPRRNLPVREQPE